MNLSDASIGNGKTKTFTMRTRKKKKRIVVRDPTITEIITLIANLLMANRDQWTLCHYYDMIIYKYIVYWKSAQFTNIIHVFNELIVSSACINVFSIHRGKEKTFYFCINILQYIYKYKTIMWFIASNVLQYTWKTVSTTCLCHVI